jgi:hypothetical protein
MKNDYLYCFFLFFFTCPHKRGEEIQTSDLQFMRRGHQPIELSLRYGPSLLYTRIHACIIYIYIYIYVSSMVDQDQDLGLEQTEHGIIVQHAERQVRRDKCFDWNLIK